MPTHRILPPVQVGQQVRIVNGRTYSGVPGQAIDAPDFDAAELAANGWIDLGLSGPTSARPVGTLPPYAAVPGASFIDTVVGTILTYDGTAWRDVTGTSH